MIQIVCEQCNKAERITNSRGWNLPGWRRDLDPSRDPDEDHTFCSNTCYGRWLIALDSGLSDGLLERVRSL